MQLTKKHKIIISIIIVVVILGIYISYDQKSRKDFSTKDDSTVSSVATTTGKITTKEIGNTGVTVSGAGNFKVEQVGEIPQPIPNLTHPLCPINGITNEMKCDSLTPEIQKVFEKKVSDIREKLLKDPTYVSGWINLGIYEKMVGDFNGAIESWKYASRLSPTDYVSLGNLGNLYAYFLKDNGQAEIYYKKAIANGPTQVYLYIQLAEVYRDIFKDNAKALALIETGLIKIPNDPSLLKFKSTLTK